MRRRAHNRHAARKARERPGNQHGPQQAAAHVDAGELRRVPVEADRPQLEPLRGPVQHEPDEDRHQNCNQDAEVEVRAHHHFPEPRDAAQGRHALRRPLPVRQQHDIAGFPDGVGARRIRLVERGQIDDVVGKVERDPVQHNAGDDLVDAVFCLQKADQAAPDAPGEHPRREEDRNQQGGRQVQPDAEDGDHDGRDDVLALRADIEEAGLIGERHAQPGQDDGGRLYQDVGDVLGPSEHPAEKRAERLPRVVAGGGQHHRRDQKAAHNRNQGRGDGLFQDFSR